MNATKLTKKLLKVCVFLFVFTLAFAVTLSNNYAQVANAATYYRQETLADYNLPDIELPAGAVMYDEATCAYGTVLKYDLIVGEDNGFSETMNWYWQGDSAPTGLPTDQPKTEVTDSHVQFYKRGVTSGYRFFAWSYIKLPDAIVAQASSVVKVRAVFDWRAQYSKINAFVAVGSYSTKPTTNYGHTLVEGGTSETIEYQGGDAKIYQNVYTDWVTLTSGAPYIVLNCVNDFPENVNALTRLQSTFSNVKLEVLIEYDGMGPTITPYYNNYTLDNAAGDYIRADDGVNFIYKGHDYIVANGLQGWSIEDTKQALNIKYYNSSDRNLTAYLQTAYFYNKNGYVYCSNVLDDSLDNGSKNSFKSYQTVETKTVSFIIYDVFAGLCATDKNGGLKTNITIENTNIDANIPNTINNIEADSTYSFAYGKVVTTSFGYSDTTAEAAKTGTFRGMLVEIEFSEWGDYIISAADANGALSVVNVSISGMDTVSPEIPDLIFKNSFKNSYVNVINQTFRYVLEIPTEVGEGESPVSYYYELLKWNGVNAYETFAGGEVDSNRISVKDTVPQILTIDGVADGQYRFKVWCNDGAGNTGKVQGESANEIKTWDFIVDSTTPNMNFKAQVGTVDYISGQWVSRSIDVKFEVTNISEILSGIQYEYRVGSNGVWKSIGAYKDTLKIGVNDEDVSDTYYFRAVSGSGIYSEIKSVVIRIDKTAPATPISYAYEDYNTLKYPDAVYNFPWSKVGAIDIGENSSPYIDQYKFYYSIVGGNLHEMTYFESSNRVIDLFDDGVSNENVRVYGLKTLTFYVEDQAGNRSADVVYKINVVKPKAQVKITRSEVAGKTYDGTLVAPASLFNYEVYIMNSLGNYVKDSTYMVNEKTYYADNDKYLVDIAANFGSAGVGADKGVAVDVANTVLSGNQYAEYYDLQVVAATEPYKANISPVKVSVSGVTVANKIYDGTTNAIITSPGELIGNIVAEDLELLYWTYQSVAFTDKNKGLHDVVISGVALQGLSETALANYVLVSAASGEATTVLNLMAEITKRTLVIAGVDAESKIYDGNSDAVVDVVLVGKTSAENILPNEVVYADYTAYYGNITGDASAEDNKTVTVTVNGLLGADAENYTFVANTVTTTANIFKKTVTISKIYAVDKVYDGKSTANFGSIKSNFYALDGIISGDEARIYLSYEFAYFVNDRYKETSAAGTHEVLFYNVSLKNSGGFGETFNTKNNYDLVVSDEGYEISTQTSVIKRKAISVSATASSKAYDTTLQAVGSTITIKKADIITGDSIYLGEKVNGTTITENSAQTTSFINPLTNANFKVNLALASYTNVNASESSVVKFVFGRYIKYDPLKHFGETTYSVDFTKAVYGEYVKIGDQYIAYDPNNAEHTSDVRYTVQRAENNDGSDGTANLYVVERYIRNAADDSLNDNYYFTNEDILFPANRTLSVSVTAEITSLQATAELFGMYGKDKDGNPIYKAGTTDINYIDYFIYGGKAIGKDGAVIEAVSYGYTIYYNGLLIPENTTDLKLLNGNNARISELSYKTVPVGADNTIVIANARLDNYVFGAGAYTNLKFEVKQAELLITIPGYYEKKHNESITLSDYKINYNKTLQNNDTIATIIGRTPSVSIIIGYDGEGDPIYYEVGTSLTSGIYDFAIDLTPDANYGFRNYKVVIDTTDTNYVFDEARNLLIKKNAINIGKIDYTALNLSNGSYTYNGIPSAKPIQPTGVYPEGVEQSDVLYTIGMYCKTVDAYINSFKYKDGKYLINYYQKGKTTAWTLFDSSTDDNFTTADITAIKNWMTNTVAKLDVSSDLANWLNVVVVDAANDYAYTFTSAKHSGEYMISCSIDEAIMTDYHTITMFATLSILQRNVSVIVPEYAYSKIYDGTSVDLYEVFGGAKVSNSNVSSAGVYYIYSTNNKFTDTIDDIKAAGTYYARAYFAGDFNTKAAYSDVITISIVPVKVKVELTSATKFNYYDYFDQEGEELADVTMYKITYNLSDLNIYSEADKDDAINYNTLLKNSVKLEYYWGANKNSISWKTKVPNIIGTYLYRITCTNQNYALISEGVLNGAIIISSTSTDGAYNVFEKTEGSNSTTNANTNGKVSYTAPSGSLLSTTATLTVTNFNNTTDTYGIYSSAIEQNGAQLGTGSYTMDSVYKLEYIEKGSAVALPETVQVTVTLDKALQSNKYMLVRISSTGVLTEIDNLEIAENLKSFTFTTDVDGVYALVERSGLGISSTLFIIIIAVTVCVSAFAAILIALTYVTSKTKKKVIAYLNASNIGR